MIKKNIDLFQSLSALVVLGLSSVFATSASAQDVSMASLLSEMTNRAAVTKVPNYVCKQASSYDRAATSPEENWFANADTSQFIREEKNGERTEWVMMEADGPGAIVRWWITAPHYKNSFYIYVDGATEPTFSGKIDELVGGNALADAPLSEESSRGRNLYLPIPYAKSIKVTCDNMEEQGNLYYQIDYRSYNADVQVESATPEVVAAQKENIASTNELLLAPEKTIPGLDGLAEVQGFTRHIESEMMDGLFEAHRIFGPGAITGLEVKLTADDMAQATRNVVLSISFDGEETVWVPVGEFFGTGVGINPYKSWYTEVTEDGTMKAYWRMPYQHEARVSFINYGVEDVDVDYKVLYEKTPWTDDSMYFHANWRQEREIETQGGTGAQDWNYTSLHGTGVYVGDVLTVFNPVEAWWGEGDEKIYVDGEEFPSHFGTGTEDYYGYAWCCPEFFQSPFHAQPRCEGPANFGNTTNLRFRPLDAIPFTTDFKFDMEIWHWTTTQVNYAVTTFWYGLPGAEIDEDEGPDRDEVEDEAAEPVQYKNVLAVKLANMELAESQFSGTVSVQDMKSFEKNGNAWQDSKQLWWRDGVAGDEISINVSDVPKGKKTLVIGATAAVDYGIVQFSWNGEPVGRPVDLFNPPAVVHRTLKLAVSETDGKDGVLSVKLNGKNADSTGTMVGVDSISWE